MTVNNTVLFAIYLILFHQLVGIFSLREPPRGKVEHFSFHLTLISVNKATEQDHQFFPAVQEEVFHQ